MLAAHKLQRVLGERGMMAVERLMGLVLTAIAVQMLLDGVGALRRGTRAVTAMPRPDPRRGINGSTSLLALDPHLQERATTDGGR